MASVSYNLKVREDWDAREGSGDNFAVRNSFRMGSCRKSVCRRFLCKLSLNPHRSEAVTAISIRLIYCQLQTPDFFPPRLSIMVADTHTLPVFFTTQTPYPLPSQKFMIPAAWKRYQLSQLVNKALSLAQPVPFDFLVQGELLRGTLAEWCNERGVGTVSAARISRKKRDSW